MATNAPPKGESRWADLENRNVTNPLSEATMPLSYSSVSELRSKDTEILAGLRKSLDRSNDFYASDGREWRDYRELMARISKDNPDATLKGQAGTLSMKWVESDPTYSQAGIDKVCRVDFALRFGEDLVRYSTTLDPTAHLNIKQLELIQALLDGHDKTVEYTMDAMTAKLDRIITTSNGYVATGHARAGERGATLIYQGSQRIELAQVNWGLQDLRSMQLGEVIFTNGSFIGANWEGASLRNVLFGRGCNLQSGFKFASSIDVTDRASKSSPVGFDNANCRNLDMSGLRIGRDAKHFQELIEGQVFVVKGTIFSGANLSRSSISEYLADLTSDKSMTEDEKVKILQTVFKGVIFDDATTFHGNREVDQQIRRLLQKCAVKIKPVGQIDNDGLTKALAGSPGLPISSQKINVGKSEIEFQHARLSTGSDITFTYLNKNQIEIFNANEIPGYSGDKIIKTEELLHLLCQDLNGTMRSRGGSNKDEMNYRVVGDEPEEKFDWETRGAGAGIFEANRSQALTEGTQDFIDVEWSEVSSENPAEIESGQSGALQSGTKPSGEIEANSSVAAEPGAAVVPIESGERDTEETQSAALSEEEIAVAEKMRKKRERFESDRQRIAERKAAEQADKEEDEPQAKAG